MNNLYIFCGESGSGKTIISKMLEIQRNLKSLPSYTTRPKRCEDEDNHIFVTDDEFDKLTDIIAYTDFNGFRYCGTSQQIQQYDIYTLDKDGIVYFKENYHGEKGYKIIYIKTPFQTRYERMFERSKKDKGYYNNDCGDNDKLNIVELSSWETCQRLNNDTIKFKDIELYSDFVVNNNDGDLLTDVVNKVWQYIRKCENEE